MKIPKGNDLLMEQQLVYCCGDEPDGEAGRQHNPERQVFSKTGKGNEEK